VGKEERYREEMRGEGGKGRRAIERRGGKEEEREERGKEKGKRGERVGEEVSSHNSCTVYSWEQ
jgi:hypothetical protein